MKNIKELTLKDISRVTEDDVIEAGELIKNEVVDPDEVSNAALFVRLWLEKKINEERGGHNMWMRHAMIKPDRDDDKYYNGVIKRDEIVKNFYTIATKYTEKRRDRSLKAVLENDIKRVNQISERLRQDVVIWKFTNNIE